MARIFHLSDLHLLHQPEKQAGILRGLMQALRGEVVRGGAPSLVAITGDVFDSVILTRAEVERTFAALLSELRAAIGPDAPLVLQPGNHDRRRLGVVGPYRGDLFQILRDLRLPGVHVGGCGTPFLADYIPQVVHRLPLHVVAYDTTHLPQGLLSAGGMFRQADLLQIAARIDAEEGGAAGAGAAAADPPRPLVLLLHHHLIPTPLTDLGRIEFDRLPWYVRVPAVRLLPHLVSNADREELTMTALGAGTALSTLHALGRPVLVLHGHKHYPSARLLRGLSVGQGDVLLCSAGSAGTVQPWDLTEHPDAAELWPSFNVIDLPDAAGDPLRARSVSFSHKDAGARVRSRPLLSVRRDGARWLAEPVVDDLPERELKTAEDLAEVQLLPSQRDPASWDLGYQRTVRRRPGEAGLTHYLEVVTDQAPTEAVVVDIRDRGGARLQQRVPVKIDLVLDGVTRYRVCGGAARTVAAAERRYGLGEGFEWVGLMVRYGSDAAKLVVRGLPEPGPGQAPFGGATDLGNGYERPWPLVREADGAWALLYPQCPGRTLLRIYWPLPRHA